MTDALHIPDRLYECHRCKSLNRHTILLKQFFVCLSNLEHIILTISTYRCSWWSQVRPSTYPSRWILCTHRMLVHMHLKECVEWLVINNTTAWDVTTTEELISFMLVKPHSVWGNVCAGHCTQHVSYDSMHTQEPRLSSTRVLATPAALHAMAARFVS